MALEGVPWMIGGGQALHTADVGRSLAYMASNGETGVVGATDLAVSALPVPGPAVSIAPGGGPVLNKYPGGAGQSYVIRNPEATELSVPATGASGATRYVIVRVSDPQYGGQTPADPAAGPYVFPDLVSSVANLPYPHIVLAKISQPSNTATITSSMITDLRTVANPRTRSYSFASPTSETLTLSTTLSTGAYFPKSFVPTATVPEWATSAQITVTWSSVAAVASSSSGAALFSYGPTGNDLFSETFAWAASGDDTKVSGRMTWHAAATIAVPKAWRGGNFTVRPRARLSVQGGGTIKIDPYGAVLATIRFDEIASIA